jgi:hypothetical protein
MATNSMARDGIEVLTGVPAGKRQPDGAFPPGMVNDCADRRLRELAETLVAFDEDADEKEKAGGSNDPVK